MTDMNQATGPDAGHRPRCRIEPGSALPAARAHTAAHDRSGFPVSRLQVLGEDQRRRDQRRHRRAGPPILLLHGAPQIAHHMATGGAEAGRDPHGRRARSARLRRQQQAAGRREPRQLLQARDGARSGRGDEALRLRQVPRHRSGPRRTRDPPHVPRSPRQGHARGGARHRADPLPLHAREHRVRPGLLPLVQLPARRARARRTSSRRQRRRQKARATNEIQLEHLRTCSDPATSTRCARTTAPARRST